MKIDLMELAEKAISGEIISRSQCLEVLNCHDDDLLLLLDAAFSVRKKYRGKKVHIQLLTNAKSGRCQEDCHYCSQSSISTAEIEKYPMVSEEKLINEARRAKELNAKRYCMALSGRRPSDAEIDRLCNAIRTIKKDIGILTCCSLGLLTVDQVLRLKEAGLDRVNHNINTSNNYHKNICTTHSYQDRVDTIRLCQSNGLEICSGGIVGQGESDQDIIDMLMELSELDVESCPLNFLIPVKGTPFESKGKDLTPAKCLKVLALARFLLPYKEIRVAGGREYHFRHLQPLIFYAADSIFVSGYLTSGGQTPDEALEMIKDMGFEFEIEGATDA